MKLFVKSHRSFFVIFIFIFIIVSASARADLAPLPPTPVFSALLELWLGKPTPDSKYRVDSFIFSGTDPVLFETYSDGNERHSVVVLANSALGAAGHGTEGAVLAAVFSLKNGNWKLVAKMPSPYKCGSWGNCAVTAQIIAIGPQRQAILITGGSYTGQGLTSTHHLLFVPTGGVLALQLCALASEESSEMCGDKSEWKITTRLEFIKGSRADVGDAVLIAEGTWCDRSQNTNHLVYFKDERYILTSQHNRFVPPGNAPATFFCPDFRLPQKK